MAKVKLECGPDGLCIFCHQPSLLEMDEEMAERIVSWVEADRPGAIQYAFPTLTADEREQIISGTHPKCFDEAFGDG